MQKVTKGALSSIEMGKCQPSMSVACDEIATGIVKGTIGDFATDLHVDLSRKGGQAHPNTLPSQCLLRVLKCRGVIGHATSSDQSTSFSLTQGLELKSCVHIAS